MKTNYIYLNHYKDSKGIEYLYVGSHTWNGPEGQLDPNYHGSSSVAKLYNWSPYKEEILEVVSTERKFIAEHYWITKYADKFGIAVVALYADKGKNSAFTSRYSKGGKMLNLHSNAGEQLIEGARKAYTKSLETKKRNGSFDRFQKAAQLTNMDHDNAVRRAKGHNYKDIGEKISNHIIENGVNRNYHACEVFKDGQSIGKFRSVTSACSEIGHRNWAVYINRRINKSKKVSRENFEFVIR